MKKAIIPTLALAITLALGGCATTPFHPCACRADDLRHEATSRFFLSSLRVQGRYFFQLCVSQRVF